MGRTTDTLRLSNAMLTSVMFGTVMTKVPRSWISCAGSARGASRAQAANTTNGSLAIAHAEIATLWVGADKHCEDKIRAE